MIPIYVITFVFILVINGVFTGNSTSVVNLMINVGVLLIKGALLLVSLKCFKKVEECADELLYEASKIQENSKNRTKLKYG